MRRLIAALLLTLLLAGCATYTASTGYERISIPEDKELPETKLSLIIESGQELPLPETESVPEEEDTVTAQEAAPEEEEALPETESVPEEEDTVIAQEAAPEEEEALPETESAAVPAQKETEIQEEAPAAAEIPAQEEREAAAVPYPERPSDITFPYLHMASEAEPASDADAVKISILLLPLGFEAMSEEDADRISASLSGLTPDFIVLTGSLENQIKGASRSQMNAVVLSGGTILFRTEYLSSDGKTASFQISDEDIEIGAVSLDDTMPSSADGVQAWLNKLQSDSRESSDAVLKASREIADGEAFFILSSTEPASSDWTSLTPYRYRTDRSFAISDSILSDGWTDLYSATHYSAETDSGITRIRGSVYERLDFIYAKGMMPSSAVSFNIAGLTDRTGALGVIAEAVLP